jgi:hypothetical protein
MEDLLDKTIDLSVNVLGKRFLERGTYGTILGSSGIGKSVLAIQIAVEAAMGREVFGLAIDAPLRVLVIQGEDSWNDRVEQVNGVVNCLGCTQEERELVASNLRIITPEHRADRGAPLFEYLRATFKDTRLDLLILNPALALVDGNVNSVESVGEFLRNHLQEFCRDKCCAALVVHHVPKPPKSGKKGRDADTTMYSGHGSAEWANAPRASITVERTMASWVFEMTIGKRGAKSGWSPDRSGNYRRYFTHSRNDKLYWNVATDADIAAANSGMGDEEFSEVFKGDADLTFETIAKRMKHYGYAIQHEDLTTLLENLVERGKLSTIIQEGGSDDGEQTWRAVKTGVVKESFESKCATALFHLEEAGRKGLNTTQLREVVPYGNGVLSDVLKALLEQGKIGQKSEGSNAIRYYLKKI